MIFGVLQPDLWAAHWAGDGLGVITAVEWIAVLGCTVRAHAKTRHGRQRPVIRNVIDDCETRTAIGAIGKWVTVAPGSRVQGLCQAF